MDDTEALLFVDALVYSKNKNRLSDVQRTIFLGSWRGKSYEKILQDDLPNYALEYLSQDVGYHLWKLLSDVVGEKVTKKTLRSPIEQAYAQQNVKEQTILESSISPQPGSLSVSAPDLTDLNTDAPCFWQESALRQDWQPSMPDVSRFYGRERELEQLEQQISLGSCRLFTIFGQGKIGKTSLAFKLTQRIGNHFDFLIWRSLDPALSFSELIGGIIQVLSHQQEQSADLSKFWEYLVNYRCLIVLDGWESFLESGVEDGSYRKAFVEYRGLLRQVGENARPRSCLLLTSREKPKEVDGMESASSHVCSLQLKGLGEVAGQQIFKRQRINPIADNDLRELLQKYDGNPFALNVVATGILKLFGGNAASFLQQDWGLYDEIRDLLDQQYERLSELEKMIVLSLTNYAEPASFTDILQCVTHPTSRNRLPEALLSLQRRSLIEGYRDQNFSLPRLLQEYLTEQTRD
jgi:hypothetical protein